MISVCNSFQFLNYTSLIFGASSIIYDKSQPLFYQSRLLRLIAKITYIIFILVLLSKLYDQTNYNLDHYELNLFSIIQVIDGLLWILLNFVVATQFVLKQTMHLEVLNNFVQLEHSYKLQLASNKLDLFKERCLSLALVTLVIFVAFLTLFILYYAWGEIIFTFVLMICVSRVEIIFSYEIQIFNQVKKYFKALGYSVANCDESIEDRLLVIDFITAYDKLFDLMLKFAKAGQFLKLISLISMMLQASLYCFSIFDLENFSKKGQLNVATALSGMILSIIVCTLSIITCYFWGTAIEQVS